MSNHQFSPKFDDDINAQIELAYANLAVTLHLLNVLNLTHIPTDLDLGSAAARILPNWSGVHIPSN